MLDPLRDSIKASGNYAPDSSEFVVYVPDGVAGCPVQVEAPDGVVLEIELPETVNAGDVINFQKLDGSWIPHLTSSTPEQAPPYSAVSLSDGSCMVGDIGGQIIEESADYQMTDFQISDYQMTQTEVEVDGNGSIHVVMQQLRTHVEEQTIAMSTRLEEHQVRYMEEQDAILGRLETVEQFLQQMAPALQGLLDRFETEQSDRNREASQMNEMLAGFQCELSKLTELTQAKTANQDESILRLEAEMTRLQESVAATSMQLQPLATVTEGRAAESQAVEQLLKLVEHERNANSEKYIAFEARLESWSSACTEKLSACESRVEMINGYAEEREARLSNNLQVISSTMQQQGTAFSQKLAEVNMAVAQRPAVEPSGGSAFDMEVIMKRFEEEQMRSRNSLQQLELALNKRLEVEQSSNLQKVEMTLNKRIEDAIASKSQNMEALKWIEVALNSCKEEQTRLSEERIALSTRLDVVESRSSSNVNRGNVERQRIEAIETRLQAMDRIERELRNSSVNNLALAQRVEKVEAEQKKVPQSIKQKMKEIAPSLAPESLAKIEKMQSRFRDDAVAIASRLDAVEASVSKSTSEAIQSTAILSRVGKMETAIEKLIREAKQIRVSDSTVSKSSIATDPGSTMTVSASNECMGVDRPGRQYENVLPKVQDALKETHSRLNRATKLPDEVLKMHSDLLKKLAKPSRNPAVVLGTTGLENGPSLQELQPRMRSMTPPRSPVPPPRYVEPSVSVMVEAPPIVQQPMRQSSRSPTPTGRRSLTPTGGRQFTPPRSGVASVAGSHVAVGGSISSPTNSMSLMNPVSSPTNSMNMMNTANFGYGVAHERGRATSPRSEPLFGGSMVMPKPMGGSAQFSQQSGSYVPSSVGGMTSEPLFAPGISTVSGTQVPTSNIRQAPLGGSGWWG